MEQYQKEEMKEIIQKAFLKIFREFYWQKWKRVHKECNRVHEEQNRLLNEVQKLEQNYIEIRQFGKKL